MGNIFHITNKQEAENCIAQIKKQHKDANHSCFAYRHGTNINFDLFWNMELTADYFKQSDDWEPTNTAWKPILAQIQWHNLHNILIIVTRYFGWTLLGIGWLIQAYWECAKQTITSAQKNNKILDIELTEQITVSFAYELLSTIMKLINKFDAKIIQETHWDSAQITLNINKWYLQEFKKEIFDQTKWQIKL